MVTKKKDWTECTTKESKLEASKAAKSVAELDAMAEAWESRGWSPRGLMAGVILARKAELGKLTDKEAERLEAIRATVARGKTLPPATAG